MAATQAASNPLDLYNHMSRIINGYLGSECTHIKATKALDPNGNVIGESQTETTIYGAISPVKADAVLEAAGTIQYGDLVFYALAEEGVLVGQQTGATEARYDMISYKGILYTVEKQVKTAYDGGVAVVCKYILRKVADE